MAADIPPPLQQIPVPFEWKVSRTDLDRLAQRVDLPRRGSRACAGPTRARRGAAVDGAFGIDAGLARKSS
jgi:hypothetical protein